MKKLIFSCALIALSNLCGMKPIIERYNPKNDAAAVNKLLQTWPTELTYEAHGMPEGTTQSILEDYRTDVLRLDGAVVGFVNFEFATKRVLPFIRDSVTGFLHTLAVAQEYQRKGYGKMLTQHAMNTMKPYVLEIVVSAKPELGDGLYKKLGFIDHSEYSTSDIIQQDCRVYAYQTPRPIFCDEQLSDGMTIQELQGHDLSALNAANKMYDLIGYSRFNSKAAATFVALDGQTVIGFVQPRLIEGNEQRYVNISRIAASPTYQGAYQVLVARAAQQHPNTDIALFYSSPLTDNALKSLGFMPYQAYRDRCEKDPAAFNRSINPEAFWNVCLVKPASDFKSNVQPAASSAPFGNIS